MSTVKIKTEPTAAAAAAAAVAVQVKLEHGDDSGDVDQNQSTITPKSKRKFICEHPGCGRIFGYADHLKRHQHEHRLQTTINIYGKTYFLTRRSLKDRWQCPVPDCTSSCKTVNSLCDHVRANHGHNMRQQYQQQQRGRNKLYLSGVDNFNVSGVCCGYHTTTGVFICQECRLVPECLLTHMQQKHGYDGKSIDNSSLPINAVNASADPNTNQHAGNPHLASAIRHPYQWRNSGIVQGWLCIVSDCGYCCSTQGSRNQHKYMVHHDRQIVNIPALVLRLSSSKIHNPCFLITRLDQASDVVTTSGNRVNQHQLDHSNNGLNTQDESEDEVDQKRKWKCDYPDCGLSFRSSAQRSKHRREHKLEATFTVYGNAYTLTRQSLDDLWSCPVPDCESTYKILHGIYMHIFNIHSASTKQKYPTSEGNYDQQQQQVIETRQYNFHYLKVDDFYVSGVRCGYHTITGLFLCNECQLVPECLLTHLQQKHGYGEKSIDNPALPESAVNANTDPNTNQHTNNSHLVSSINQPFQQQHPNIFQGWCCVTSDCGHFGYSAQGKSHHKRRIHQGEQILTVPALVLQLFYGKAQSSCLLITRLDTITTNNIEPDNSASQDSSEGGDNGDELALSEALMKTLSISQ